MEKKYKLTEEFEYDFLGEVKLYRIEALKDFGNVKKGDKGGYVQSEANLSQEGNCWVFDKAEVFGDALVFGDAQVFGNATVYCKARVYGYAMVYGNAKVYDNAEVCDGARVYGDAMVYENAKVCCKARVYGNAEVYDNAQVSDNAEVFGNALVDDNSRVCGKAIVSGNAQVSGSAEIKDDSDYIIFKNWWSSGRFFTWTKSNNMWKVGCFYGTGEELIKKAYKDSELSGREYERVVKYVESMLRDTKYIRN